MKMINGKQELDNLVASNDVVLVDFFATWCGPCKMLAPILDKLADDFEGRAAIAKVDIDQNNDLAAAYRVMAVPTMVLFKNGKPVEQFSGMRPYADLANLIKSHIN